MKLKALLISVLVLGGVACGGSGPASSSSSQKALGFGVDDLFGTLTATPSVIADGNCTGFSIAPGDFLTVSAQESSFSLIRDDLTAAFEIQVPRQGNYIFQGRRPSRIANEIISYRLRVRASMDPDTADITLEKLDTHSTCLIRRCPAFGVCE